MLTSTTYELPAEIEDVLDHLDPATPARPEVAARVRRESGGLPMWPAISEEATGYWLAILTAESPVLSQQAFLGFVACVLHCGRVYGRLEATMDD